MYKQQVEEITKRTTTRLSSYPQIQEFKQDELKVKPGRDFHLELQDIKIFDKYHLSI